jgi:hypothetical protein
VKSASTLRTITAGRSNFSELGDVLRSNDWEIRPLVNEILHHNDFVNAVGRRTRQPVEWFTGAAAAFDLSEIGENGFDYWQLQQMGQVPFEPPNVASWPDDDRWTSASHVMARGNSMLNWELGQNVTNTVQPTPLAVLGHCGVMTPTDSTLAAMERAMTNHTPDWYPSDTAPVPHEAAKTLPAERSTLPASIDTPMHRPARSPSRRKFLGFAAAGVASAGGGTLALNRSGTPIPGLESVTESISSSPTPTTPPLIASKDVAGRTLVVIELPGGNDGVATLVPRNAGVLYDRREPVHIPDEELLDFTDEFGWHPRLEGVADHGLAALVGLGATNDADGNHFEMERRW